MNQNRFTGLMNWTFQGSRCPITERETQVLRLLAFGCTYEQIAERLGVSPHTVTTHIKNLYRKLDVHTAASAVMRGVELQVLGGLRPGTQS